MLLEKGKPKDFKIGDDDYRYAIAFLSAITNHSSRAEYSSTMGYRNKKYYQQDIHVWKRRLRDNQCTYTLAKADSIMKMK